MLVNVTTSAMFGTGRTWADSSAIWARCHVATDPVPLPDDPQQPSPLVAVNLPHPHMSTQVIILAVLPGAVRRSAAQGSWDFGHGTL